MKKTTNEVCPKCHGKVSFEKVSPDYFCVCLNCDEDFYEFELVADKLKNIKDSFKSFSNAELHKLKVALDLEIYLSSLAIQYGAERKK